MTTAHRPDHANPTRRLFVALSLPEAIVQRIADWQRRTMAEVDVRVLPRANLHITLVFIGDRPASDVDAIVGVLADSVSTARRPAFSVHRYRETARLGMLALREVLAGDDHYVGRANALTGHLMRELEHRGMYRREHRSWTPHITVSRFKTAPRLDAPPLDLGAFSPADVVLFRSVLTPSGSVYERLASLPLPD